MMNRYIINKVMIRITSIVSIFVLLLCGFPMKASAADLSGSVTDYADSFLYDTSYYSLIQSSGNLSGRTDPQDPECYVIGWFEYDITVDVSGWYELKLNYDSDINDRNLEGGFIEYIIDGSRYLNDFPVMLSPGELKVGNIFLSAGNHKLKINNPIWWSISPLMSYQFVQLSTDLSKNVRIGLDPDTAWMALNLGAVSWYDGTAFKGGHFIRKAEAFNIYVYTGGSAAGTFTVEVYNRETDLKVKEYNVNVLTSADEVTNIIPMSVDAEGIYYCKYKANGQYVDSSENLIPVEFTVIDTTPANLQQSIDDASKTLVETIDCTTRIPDYYDVPTQITDSGFGSFRETGNNLWDYFSYTLQPVTRDTPYIIEVEYPNDKDREIYIEVRDRDPLMYVMGTGVESGDPYPVTNSFETYSYFYWPRFDNESPRVVITKPNGSYPAAAKTIRVYKVNGELPALPVSNDGRDFTNWYEESPRWYDPFGAKDFSIPEIIRSVENWAKTMRYTGANVMHPTANAYQECLYPISDVSVHASKYTGDMMRLLLLVAEKYGLKVLPQFSLWDSEQRLKYQSATGDDRYQLFMWDKNGNHYNYTNNPYIGMYNPLHPENKQYIENVLLEYVRRYKDSPAMMGADIRAMAWFPSTLNYWFNLDWGYDPYTAQQFCAYLGITDPGTPQSRYSTFTSTAYKDTWIKWRIDQINLIIRSLESKLCAEKSDFMLYTDVMGEVFGGDDKMREAGYENISGSNIGYINCTYNTGRRGDWQTTRTMLTNPAVLGQFRNSRAHLFGYQYMEDGGGSIPPSVLGQTGDSSLWTSGHMNPNGRNYLERFAMALAETDAVFLGHGGNLLFIEQPVMREFLAEYRQLPKDAFRLVNSLEDPVVVRDCQGSNNLLYAVNKYGVNKRIELDFGKQQTITRVTTGTQYTTDNNKIVIELQPYQLMVFASEGDPVVNVSITADDVTQGLAGRWNFDGDVYDVVGTADGTYYGGTDTYSTGKIGQALSMDAIDDYVKIPFAENLNQFTMSAWVKVPANAADSRNIVVRSNDWGPVSYYSHQLRINSMGKFEFFIFDGGTRTVTGETTVQPDTWYLVTGTASNNGSMCLYVNGKEEGATNVGNMWTGGNSYWVGANTGNGEWFGGFIDDLRIYNRVLSSSEVNDIYNATKGISDVASGLEHRWLFNQNLQDSVSTADGEFYGEDVVYFDIGKLSQAIPFDGTDDYIRIPYLHNITQYTMSAWVKVAAGATTGRNIIVRTNDWGPTSYYSHQIRINSNGKFEFFMFDGGSKTVTGTTEVQADTWYFITCTATNNGKMRLFVNGLEEGTAQNIGTMWESGNSFWIGANSGNGTWFEGTMDDLRFYSRALSNSEINSVYQATVTSEGIEPDPPHIPGTDITTGLLGRWQFDENLDDSIRTADGTFYGGTVSYITGKLSQAISLDGIDDYVKMPYPDNPGKTTMCAWVKVASGSTTDRNIVVKSNYSGPTVNHSQQLKINSSGKFEFFIYDSGNKTVTGTTTVQPDTWYFIAGVATNSGQMHLYVNGTEEGTPVGIGTMWQGGDSIWVGANSKSGTWFNGAVDDLRIYKLALSSSEINDIYQATRGLNDVTSGLMGRWQFDESLSDSIGTVNGVFYGGTASYTDGKPLQAISLDGVDDYVKLPDTSLPTACTMSAWVKMPSGATTSRSIIAWSNDNGPAVTLSNQLRVDNNGKFQFYLWDGGGKTVTGITVVQPDTWYFVTGVAANNGSMRLYVNGVEEGNSLNIGTMWTGGNSYWIGANSLMGSWFSGVADDLRVYDRVLDSNEILDTYNATK